MAMQQPARARSRRTIRSDPASARADGPATQPWPVGRLRSGTATRKRTRQAVRVRLGAVPRRAAPRCRRRGLAWVAADRGRRGRHRPAAPARLAARRGAARHASRHARPTRQRPPTIPADSMLLRCLAVLFAGGRSHPISPETEAFERSAFHRLRLFGNNPGPRHR